MSKGLIHKSHKVGAAVGKAIKFIALKHMIDGHIRKQSHKVIRLSQNINDE